MRIKNGVDPSGARLLVRTHLEGGYSWIPYRVIAVTGNEPHAPSPGGPVVYMELADKHPSTPAHHVALPLSVFAQRAIPEGAGDKFWEDETARA